MNGKDKKRGTTKFGDQMKILIDSLANQDKSRAKCVRKLFRGVTRNSDPEDAEAVQLLLGRDHEWRIHQVKVMKAVSKIIRLMMITEGTTFSEMEWTELVELLISCRLFDVVNLLLRIKIPQSVTEDDAGSSFGDSWESVYFHSLEITSNIISSGYICHTESITKPFLDEVVKHRSFLDVIITFAMDTSRPIMTCHALQILAFCCNKYIPTAKKVGRKKELFPRLCEYVHKNFATKLISDWFKGGVEQYEFDMMGDRPQVLIPVYFQEAFKEHSVEEMTKDEQRQSVMTFAYSMHLYSLKLMAILSIADDTSRETVVKDPSLLKPCIRWLESPVTSKFSSAALNETLLMLTGLCNSEAICHKLISTHNLIQLMERAVYYGTFEHVSNIFHLTTKIASHEGMLRSKIGAVESIARSATVHMYSHVHELRLYVLTYLTYIVETEGVHHMIKYFGPHHIHHYPSYYFNEARQIDMNVTDLLKGYKYYAESAYLHAESQFREWKKTHIGLDQEKAERFKLEGNKAFVDNDYRLAISKYTDALVICPPLRKEKQLKSWYDLPITLYCNRAQCHLSVKQYNQAIRDCDKAIARCIGAADPTNRIGNVRNNTLMRKALYRRSRGLFFIKDYHRALCDITLCLIGDEKAEYFISHKDKVLLQYRDMHGLEPIPSCDMCGLGIGKKLKRCARCTGLYCSRDCQLKAWDKFHKVNCQEFVKTRIESSESD
ncbi:uncharacterized protein LOC129276768 [Lytechinus pictus]|uniref:uncharacterized protein LOC129276768 n=1 Tax=Lytechinus pictus TaxID=7653 RepID=UPI0030B9EB87